MTAKRSKWFLRASPQSSAAVAREWRRSASELEIQPVRAADGSEKRSEQSTLVDREPRRVLPRALPKSGSAEGALPRARSRARTLPTAAPASPADVRMDEVRGTSCSRVLAASGGSQRSRTTRASRVGAAASLRRMYMHRLRTPEIATDQSASCWKAAGALPSRVGSRFSRSRSQEARRRASCGHTQPLAVQREAMDPILLPVEHVVGNRGLADPAVPVLDWQLRGDRGRAPVGAIIGYLERVFAPATAAYVEVRDRGPRVFEPRTLEPLLQSAFVAPYALAFDQQRERRPDRVTLH